MTAGRRGRIVLLNGPSSSGKTSIGRALQDVLPKPWFLFPVDALGAMRAAGPTARTDSEERDAVLRRTRAGYHRAVAGLAAAGNDVIMDYPLSEPWRLDDLLDVLDGLDVLLVHVTCDLEELDRRELARGNRPPGLGRSQRVFEHGTADVTVDSTSQPPHASAAAIVRELGRQGVDRAFDRLRASRVRTGGHPPT